MRLSGKLALKIGAVGVAAGAILAPVTVAHAANPTIAVTPHTGLQNGETVTVTGAGWAAGTAFKLLQCSDQDQCDFARSVDGTTDGDGNIPPTPFVVHTGAIGTGTCDSPSTNCFIGALVLQQAAVTPIAFAAAPPATPAITVTPKTGLADGDSVTVAGSGFTAGATIELVECSTNPPTSFSQCQPRDSGNDVTVGGDGTFSKPITVTTGPIGSGTCTAGSSNCGIAANDVADGQDFAAAGITFADASPSGATIAISPITNVKSGSKISVSGLGFAANKPVYAVECSGTGGQTDCDTNALGTGQTNASGAFTSVQVPVHSGAVGDGTCNVGQTCYIAATTDPTGTDPTQSATAPFSFGKSGTKHRDATKTNAAYSSKKQLIAGVVSSKGSGVKGLKTKLEFKKGKHWKTVGRTKTGKGGVFVYTNIAKSGDYEVKTKPHGKYKGSTSDKITV